MCKLVVVKIVYYILLIGALGVAAVAADVKGKSTADLMRVLQSRGLTAKPYYNGAVDPVGRPTGQPIKLSRKEVRERLSNINLPLVNDRRQLDDVSMTDAITYIQGLLRANGANFNISINPYLVVGGMGAGSPGTAVAGGVAAGGAAAPVLGPNGMPAGGPPNFPFGGGFPGQPGGAGGHLPIQVHLTRGRSNCTVSLCPSKISVPCDC